MNLLVTKYGITVLEGEFSNKSEISEALHSVIPIKITKERDGYRVTLDGNPMNPIYGMTWDPNDITYDALKSGYLSKNLHGYKFYKFETL
jgi:hypothetical protein